MPKYTPAEYEHFETTRAWLKVLQHTAIRNAVDLDALEDIAVNAISERHRLRASSILQKARQQAAEKMAYFNAEREEVLRDKGLASSTTEHRHTVDLGGMDMDKLRALAAGPSQVVEVEAVIIDIESDDDVLLDVEVDPEASSS